MDDITEFKWTGERLTTAKDTEVAIHHLHRYAIALDYIENKKVLDIASGEGYGSSLLSSKAAFVYGVDIDEEVVNFSSKKYKSDNIKFLVGSASQIPIESQSVDVVVSFETIEHHDKHKEMFIEMKRVLKPDGILIMSSPDKLNYSDVPKFNNPFHVKELYREEFKALISLHFNHVEMYYQSMLYGSLIVPENGHGNLFSEYTGGFDSIKKNKSIETPVYNLCIASDQIIQNQQKSDFSFFNAQQLLETLINKETEIYNSKTYKVGKWILYPFKKIKSVINNVF